MLFRDEMRLAIESRTEDLGKYLAVLTVDVAFYREAIARLSALAPDECERAVGEAAAALPGECTGTGSFEIAFGKSWQNHEQARSWALDILDGRVTFAADGSQIYAAKKTNMPVAAVQIGWFENPHDPGRPYRKGARFELLTPADLFAGEDDPLNPDMRVEERRYLGEVARVEEFLEQNAGWHERDERMPVAFFDNPLLVPFSQKGLQASFLSATVRLVETSRRTRVPVVGYVDRSFSRDLIRTLDSFGGRAPAGGEAGASASLYDAGLLLRANAGSGWGTRTCFFYSNRRGLEAFRQTGGRSGVGFCYLSTTVDTPPARLDIPSWVFEAGLLDETVDVVRGECVIGLGYPYGLESADQAAVISVADREVFFRALQDFSDRQNLGFNISRKDESKARRR